MTNERSHATFCPLKAVRRARGVKQSSSGRGLGWVGARRTRGKRIEQEKHSALSIVKQKC